MCVCLFVGKRLLIVFSHAPMWKTTDSIREAHPYDLSLRGIPQGYRKSPDSPQFVSFFGSTGNHQIPQGYQIHHFAAVFFSNSVLSLSVPWCTCGFNGKRTGRLLGSPLRHTRHLLRRPCWVATPSRTRASKAGDGNGHVQPPVFRWIQAKG